MSVAMMFAHCNEVMLVYTGERELKVNFIARLFKGMIRKVVFGPEPYKKNSATVPQFKVTDEKDFDTQKQILLDTIDRFFGMSIEEAQKIEHPLFGQMKRDEVGWAMYKHLNHHLKQFNV